MPPKDTLPGGAQQVTLGQYKGLRAVCRPAPVTERQLDAAVETLRLRAAVWQPWAGACARRDRVCIDFAGFTPQGQPIPESAMQGVTLIVGSGKLLRGVEDALCGHAAGERFALPFTYPADFRVGALAGQQAVFQLVLHSVERRCKPPADDAFAQTQGCPTMAALREKLRRQKTENHLALAQNGAAEALLTQVAQGLTAKLPEAQIAAQARREVEAWERSLRASGQTPEQFYRLSGHDRAWQLAQAHAKAEAAVRRQAAVYAVAQAEGLAVAPQELADEQARLAEKQGGKAPLPDEKAIEQALLTQKVKAFLWKNAIVE